MKRFLLVFVFTVTVFFANAQIYWDGGGGNGQWNTAANWVGDVLPLSTDDVVLDNSNVSGTYTVTLPTGSTNITVLTLTITPSSGNNITLILPSGNTANPGLTINGSSGDVLILNNGAILQNSSGASSGNGVAIAGTFRINNGGHYIHNTRRGNAGIVSQLSTASGTELGLFEFDVPSGGSYSPSMSNRTYGSLLLSSAASSGSITYTASGSNPCNINGNFEIASGVTFSTGFGATGVFTVFQNFTQQASSTFNMQNTTNSNLIIFKGDVNSSGTITKSGAGNPTIQLAGSANQSVSITDLQNTVIFEINNNAGASLTSPLLLPESLILTNGKITTTSTNLLTLPDTATYSGGSASSFIDGPIKKFGSGDFIFPVGKGGIYAPIGISGGSGGVSTDAFTAEYLRLDPRPIFGINYATGIDHVSWVEYWQLDRNAGTASKVVSLDVHATSFCWEPTNTFISRFDGSQWTNEPSTGSGFVSCSGGASQCGTLTTNSAISNFSPFTLATDRPYNDNPLPIFLKSFDVVKLNNTNSKINWELTECCSRDAKFEIQKSGDSRSFVNFATVNGSETNRFYAHNDSRLGTGITYYRLKMTDVDGAVSYSKIVAVVNQADGFVITSLSPNPASSVTKLSISSAKMLPVSFAIYNTNGAIVKRWSSVIAEGNAVVDVDIARLPAGVYTIMAVSGTSKAATRLVKQ